MGRTRAPVSPQPLPSMESASLSLGCDGFSDAVAPALDDLDSSQEMLGPKKKRTHVSVGGEKGGKGLRHFSMKVCQKVESKGHTTYNEVADELVSEFTNPSNNHVSPDQQQYDEKNIRRRVYDALNVLMALDIISKEKKEIQWKGVPIANANDSHRIKAEQFQVRERIEQKTAYLQELEEQMKRIQNLVLRNQKLYNCTGGTPAGGVALPFILVQTQPQATVGVEISEDMQVVHFDFNSTPFELHDDAFVLKAMSYRNGKVDSLEDVASYDDKEYMDSMFQDNSSVSSVYQNFPSYHSPKYGGNPTSGSIPFPGGEGSHGQARACLLKSRGTYQELHSYPRL